jgi:hypothetical protein
MTITINVTGLDEARKTVITLADKIANPDLNLMKRIGDTVVDDIDEKFMTRGYGTWPPLKSSTIKHKKGNSMVLIDTGAMFGSTRIKAVKEGQVEVDVPYGGAGHDPDVPIYHQRGTRKMPQRKIAEVTPLLIEKVVATVKKWVEEMVMAAGKEM